MTEIKKEIDKSHDNYVNNIIGDITHDSKPFWKFINSQKTCRQGIRPLKAKTDQLVESDNDKAKVLNE